MEQGDTIIVSLNVNGLNQDKKRREIFRYIRGKKPDIILLQETYSTREVEHLWSNEWGRKVFFSHGVSNSRGVAMLFSKKFNGQVDGFWNDTNGRFLALQLKIADKKILLINVYGPNEDDPTFFHSIFEFLNQQNHDFEEVIFGGDFNLTLNFQQDKRGSSYDNHVKKRESVLEYMELYQLCDIWRLMHPDTFQFSWRRSDQHVLCRLDYFLISQGLVARVRRSQICPRFLTDHGLIIMELQLADNPRGPGYWKFNNLHLQDPDFLDQINMVIEEYRTEVRQSHEQHTPDVVWEGLKVKLVAEATKYSIQKAKSHKNVIEVLQLRLIKLDKKLVEGGPNVDKIKKDIKKTEEFMEDELEKDTLGAIFRSKTQYYGEGEKPSAYFFNLERSRARAKAVNSLDTNDGFSITDQKQILLELRNYYKKLYETRPHIAFDRVNNGEAPSISEDMRSALELPISLEELSEALKTMPNKKCPGLDGLTAEFYKIFWEKIKDLYFEAIQFAVNSNILHQSARMGLISLLPKKDRVPTIIKNWRPLTLMNVDYKIYSKALSLRIKEVMPYIISEDQTGFMAGRDISLNSRKLLDIMRFVDEQNLAAILVQIDYEQAFDSLEYDSIWGAMRYFNFGPMFISYVQTLFAQPFSCVMNSGWKSSFFYPSRSVKQGCSTSPFLFNICAELIAIAIRKNDKIKGVTINNVEHKISQFADDTTLFLLFDREVLLEVVKVFDHYCNLLGLKVNYDKTSIYRLGSLKNTNAKLYTNKPFYWTNNPIKILGITITNDIQEMQRLNLVPIFVKMHNVLSIWRRRGLSLMGKVVVVNSLVASLFTHVVTVLDLLDDIYLKEYDKLVKEFLWNGKSSKMRLLTLHNSKQYGGLGLVDLRSKDIALKTQWVAKCKRFSTLQSLADYFLPIGYNWQHNVSVRDVKKMHINSTFWRDVLKCWASFSYQSRDSALLKNKILRMPLMYNSAIRVGGGILTPVNAHFLGNFITIQDLFRKTPNELSLLNFQEILNQVGQNKVIAFRISGVSKALSPLWIKCVKGMASPPSSALGYDFSNIPKKITTIVYNDKCYKEKSHSQLAAKWSSKIQHDHIIDCELLDLAFSNVKNIVSCVKLRDFQFRFLHRRVFTNKILYKWKITETDRCTFCHDEYETMEHLFLHCQYTKRFWQQVSSWYEAMTDLEINLTDFVIVFNQYAFETNKISILDTIILMAKQYIYRCRCIQRDLDFHNFKMELFQTCKIERRLAYINDRRKAFCKKWSLFLK